jgi:tRNA-2-methylthio-N6-dimethylallyladenosine synthase
LIHAQQVAFNHTKVGHEMMVLLDRPGRFANQAHARSPYMQSVHVDDAAHRIGELAKVRILSVHPNSLQAELVSSPQEMSYSVHERRSTHVQQG